MIFYWNTILENIQVGPLLNHGPFMGLLSWTTANSPMISYYLLSLAHTTYHYQLVLVDTNKTSNKN